MALSQQRPRRNTIEGYARRAEEDRKRSAPLHVGAPTNVGLPTAHPSPSCPIASAGSEAYDHVHTRNSNESASFADARAGEPVHGNGIIGYAHYGVSSPRHATPAPATHPPPGPAAHTFSHNGSHWSHGAGGSSVERVHTDPMMGTASVEGGRVGPARRARGHTYAALPTRIRDAKWAPAPRPDDGAEASRVQGEAAVPPKSVSPLRYSGGGGQASGPSAPLVPAPEAGAATSSAPICLLDPAAVALKAYGFGFSPRYTFTSASSGAPVSRPYFESSAPNALPHQQTPRDHLPPPSGSGDSRYGAGNGLREVNAHLTLAAHRLRGAIAAAYSACACGAGGRGSGNGGGGSERVGPDGSAVAAVGGNEGDGVTNAFHSSHASSLGIAQASAVTTLRRLRETFGVRSTLCACVCEEQQTPLRKIPSWGKAEECIDCTCGDKSPSFHRVASKSRCADFRHRLALLEIETLLRLSASGEALGDDGAPVSDVDWGAHDVSARHRSHPQHGKPPLDAVAALLRFPYVTPPEAAAAVPRGVGAIPSPAAATALALRSAERLAAANTKRRADNASLRRSIAALEAERRELSISGGSGDAVGKGASCVLSRALAHTALFPTAHRRTSNANISNASIVAPPHSLSFGPASRPLTPTQTSNTATAESPLSTATSSLSATVACERLAGPAAVRALLRPRHRDGDVSPTSGAVVGGCPPRTPESLSMFVTRLCADLDAIQEEGSGTASVAVDVGRTPLPRTAADLATCWSAAVAAVAGGTLQRRDWAAHAALQCEAIGDCAALVGNSLAGLGV